MDPEAMNKGQDWTELSKGSFVVEPTHLKNMRPSNWIPFLQGSGEIKTYLIWNHQLVSLTHRIHGTKGIFLYIYHKNQLNLGMYMYINYIPYMDPTDLGSIQSSWTKTNQHLAVGSGDAASFSRVADKHIPLSGQFI